MTGRGGACLPTAEHVRADVGRAASLVLQQVILTHQVLSQTEVRDGYSVSPGEKQKVSVNEGHPARAQQCRRGQLTPKQRCGSTGLSEELESLGEDKWSCKTDSIPMGRDSTAASTACKILTGRNTSTSSLSSTWLSVALSTHPLPTPQPPSESSPAVKVRTGWTRHFSTTTPRLPCGVISSSY